MLVLRFGFLQEHNIGIGMAADYAQLTTVERPVKVGDVFRFEVRDLLSRCTVEGLEPDQHPGRGNYKRQLCHRG